MAPSAPISASGGPPSTYFSAQEPVAYVRAPVLIEGLRLGAFESVMK